MSKAQIYREPSIQRKARVGITAIGWAPWRLALKLASRSFIQSYRIPFSILEVLSAISYIYTLQYIQTKLGKIDFFGWKARSKHFVLFRQSLLLGVGSASMLCPWSWLDDPHIERWMPTIRVEKHPVPIPPITDTLFSKTRYLSNW